MISRAQIDKVLGMYKTEKSSQTMKVHRNSSQTPGQDGVKLSFTTQDVETVKALVRDLPDIREDRVEPLMKAVQSGEYSVDPKTVADKLVGRLLVDKVR